MAIDICFREKVISSSERPLIHQIANAQQEETHNHDSSRIFSPKIKQAPLSHPSSHNPSNLPAPSEKSFRELQALYKKLEEDLAKKNRDLKAAHYNVTSARQETTKLKTKQDNKLKQQRDELLAKHREEIEMLNKRADGAAEERKNLSAQVEKFKTSN
jgi:chromosome segregation ATPase